MKREYDFSKGVRGKFFRQRVKLNLPVYLDEEVFLFVQDIASKRKADASTVVNQLLRSNMELARTIKQKPGPPPTRRPPSSHLPPLLTSRLQPLAHVFVRNCTDRRALKTIVRRAAAQRAEQLGRQTPGQSGEQRSELPREQRGRQPAELVGPQRSVQSGGQRVE